MKKYLHLYRFFLLSAALLFGVQMKAQNQLIYNGILERGYPSAQYDNAPYYPEQYQKGKVTFRGYTYTDVSMKTDLVKGQLIILSPATAHGITYAPEEIERAEIGGVEYKYLKEPANGWYEVIAQTDDWSIYRRNYISNTTREVRQNNMCTKFFPAQRIYLCMQGKWSAIGSINALCKHFNEHKTEIKAYAKQHDLRFDSMDIDAWQHLAEYIKRL